MPDNTDTESGLIPKHGGYRCLKSFQVTEVVYDVTVHRPPRPFRPPSPPHLPRDPGHQNQKPESTFTLFGAVRSAAPRARSF